MKCWLTPVSYRQVKIHGPFWSPRLAVHREATLPAIYRQLKKTGRIDAFDLKGKAVEPHIFWDSDVAKWVEAACYDLCLHPDEGNRKRVDSVVDHIVKAQQPDGYVNTYFTRRPAARWTNLRDGHELYCAGHLIEAAVAHVEATGREEFLQVACRFADLIRRTFGRGKKRGYPGHQELELALIKLYRATGIRRYLELAKYFLDERGRKPLYFEREARARGEDPGAYRFGTLAYQQAHLPVREQREATGHAVRALYMYSAMTDLCQETQDTSLMSVLKEIWEDICSRKMYLTGGVGSSMANEGFTAAYDLPEEEAYAETCAAVALVFFCHRMLQYTRDGRYADVMERAIYNGVISGVSLTGTHFFYANPMARAATPPEEAESIWDGSTYARRAWFGCACCPTNVARFLGSLGGYVYSLGRKSIWVHLYTGGEACLILEGQKVTVRQKTHYPWTGRIALSVEPEQEAGFCLHLRIPAWCRKAEIRVGGKLFSWKRSLRNGYACIDRRWRRGDLVELDLDLPAETVHAHPRVKQARGKTALMRGPLVYCLEAQDQPGVPLERLRLSPSSLVAVYKKDLLGGVQVIQGRAASMDESGWKHALYRPVFPKWKSHKIIAVPYCTWANRSPGAMRIWLRSEDGC